MASHKLKVNLKICLKLTIRFVLYLKNKLGAT